MNHVLRLRSYCTTALYLKIMVEDKNSSSSSGHIQLRTVDIVYAPRPPLTVFIQHTAEDVRFIVAVKEQMIVLIVD
jgi:hypothetical protein